MHESYQKPLRSVCSMQHTTDKTMEDKSYGKSEKLQRYQSGHPLQDQFCKHLGAESNQRR
jgi:hypothetical protein